MTVAPEISVIIPVYNEEDNIEELVRRIGEIFENDIQKTYELLVINDGSTDTTAEKLEALKKDNPFLRPIFLARNYGQSTAMQAGFDQAQGQLIITMDGDLQNDPADIKRMLELQEAEKADMVSGWRKNRHDDIVRVYFSKVANKLICKVAGLKIHDFGCSLKVYKASIIKRIRLYGELHRFLPALVQEAGGKIVEMEVTHHRRKAGVSKYGLDRTFRVMLDLLLIAFMHRYLHRPLHFFGGIGLAIGVVGGLICLYLVGIKLLLGAAIGGRPLLLLGVIMIVISVILIMQGLTAEILIRVLHEKESRSQYRIRED
ncbi:MAG: glycosyltransferase family 2 protein [Alphaproteobacteria bacterium]|nr:glycosyltransferase family 2 protein [Alphaproteobacteria bacterium]